MSKCEGDDLVRTLVGAFLDTHLGTGHYSGIPFVRDETAQSHLFRIIDFLNPEIWNDPSTSAISKEVILTLLYCAARLYEGRVHIKEAVALIENKDTRAILSLGVQGHLSQVIHQRCVESIRSNKSDATNAENCSQQAGLFSAVRKNGARQLNHQAMITEHIYALCRSHSAALQNSFDSPRIDEPFMFRNFITLSNALNICERSWLVTLLPDLFQWESQESCSDVNGLNNGSLTTGPDTIKGINRDICANEPEAITSSEGAITPAAKETAISSREMFVSLNLADSLQRDWGEACNNALSNKLVSPPSHTSVTISTELQDRITLGAFEDIREALNFADFSRPPIMTTDGDVQHWLGNATPEERNSLVRICDNRTAPYQQSASELSRLMNKVPEFEKWMKLLQERSVTFRNLASVEAVTSVLKAAHGFPDGATCQKEEGTLVREKTEREDTRDRDKGLQDRQVLSPGDTLDGGRNLVESDDDCECIFPFSPPAGRNASSGKPNSTFPPRSTATYKKELHGPAKTSDRRGNNREPGLMAIPEEPE